MSRIQSAPISALCGGMVFLLALTACNRNDVKVQRVPKEAAGQPAVASPHSPHSPHGGAMGSHLDVHAGMGMAQPQLKWTTPSGWEEKPGSQMRVASFTVEGKDGQMADVSVIPIATTSREVDLVNMWRQQMRLPMLNETEAGKHAENVTIGSEPAKLYEVASEEAIIDGKSRARMLIAMIKRGQMEWYFKMAGEDSLVREQKPAFVQFLKSVSFDAGGANQAADPHGHGTYSSAGSSAVAAGVPANWQELPGGDFLAAKFLIKGSGEEKAEVNVGSAGGSMLANVNRWRGQVGLAAVNETELAKLLQPMEVRGIRATLVDLTGTGFENSKPIRVMTVIVPEGGQTWFYKIMGDAGLVEQQKDTFLRFVQSAKY